MKNLKDKIDSFKQDSEQDALQKLMCSVPGCPRRWSVHLDGYKPMCSQHQWGNAEKADPAKVRHWLDSIDP